MTTPAGWYDDPEDSKAQRYWDGQDWTPHRQRKPVAQPAPPPVMSSPPLPEPAASMATPPPGPPPPLPPPPPPPNQPAQWSPPGQQPVGQSPKRSINPIVVIGVIAFVIVLAVGGFVGYKQFRKSGPSSPEDQIRSVVQREVQAWNNSDFSYNPELYCKANSSQDQAGQKEGRELRTQAGKMSVSVDSIHLIGDQATVDVTVKFQNAPGKTAPSTMQFVKEDGRWKDCTPPDSSGD